MSSPNTVKILNDKDTETQNGDDEASAFFVPSCLRGESSILPEWHIRELGQGLAEYEANPREGRPWPEIRDRLLARR